MVEVIKMDINDFDSFQINFDESSEYTWVEFELREPAPDGGKTMIMKVNVRIPAGSKDVIEIRARAMRSLKQSLCRITNRLEREYPCE